MANPGLTPMLDKVVALLSAGPRTRDELIVALYGAPASSPRLQLSYQRRVQRFITRARRAGHDVKYAREGQAWQLTTSTR